VLPSWKCFSHPSTCLVTVRWWNCAAFCIYWLRPFHYSFAVKATQTCQPHTSVRKRLQLDFLVIPEFFRLVTRTFLQFHIIMIVERGSTDAAVTYFPFTCGQLNRVILNSESLYLNFFISNVLSQFHESLVCKASLFHRCRM
jgi:hypothetical protein